MKSYLFTGTKIKERRRNMVNDSDVLMNFRDSPVVARRIEELIMKGEFPSRSEFIRIAVGELLNQYASTSNSKKVTLSIPNKIFDWANYNIIGPGYELNFETLILSLLKEYVEAQKEEIRKIAEEKYEISLRIAELKKMEAIHGDRKI